MSGDVVVGIDLGTTNSTVAVVRDGRPLLIPVDGDPLLPSVVGATPEGELLVGAAARNQYHLYPDRSVRSVKRRMGEDVQLRVGDTPYTPVEVSAIILRRLKTAAEQFLDAPVTRAVITVPAYFSDAQRTATREAGEVAGLEVARILNEPTAAALCYASGDESPRTSLVFDLGGGTFDVSVVRSRGDLTEVLSSHGDTRLGGDDLDTALVSRLQQCFQDESGARLDGDLQARARLTRAAEAAKIALSRECYTNVLEEHLAEVDGIARHLDLEVSRADFEELCEPLLARTSDSVQTALREAGLLARDLDDVILVGGSTRIPRVAERLTELLGQVPRQDVNPDQAVAQGAALVAARIAGFGTRRILVDVTPFSFGTSYLGWALGAESPHCYKPIIRRSSPVPVRQTAVFYTASDGQDAVDVRIYQGEQVDARLNLQVGRFLVEGLDTEQRSGSPIVFDLSLNLDGLLEVRVTEKRTGLEKRVEIQDAFRKLTETEVTEARGRIAAAVDRAAAYGASGGEARVGPPRLTVVEDVGSDPPVPDAPTSGDPPAWTEAAEQLRRAEALGDTLSPVDREEVAELMECVRQAMKSRDRDAVAQGVAELGDVLFYLAS